MYRGVQEGLSSVNSQHAISPRRAMTPGDIIATICYVCLAFSCASVLLRVVVRYKWLDAGLRLDDWFMIVALVSLSSVQSFDRLFCCSNHRRKLLNALREQVWYSAFCAAIIAFATIENRHPVITEPVADRLLLVSIE